MRIINIASYTLLALSLPQIAFANESNVNSNQDSKLQSKQIISLITKLKEAKQEVQQQKQIIPNTPEFDTFDNNKLSAEFSPISTQAKDLQIKRNSSPLEQPPTRLFNLETANQLPKGSVQFTAGSHQANPADNRRGNTGYQNYYTSLDWGTTDKLQLSVAAQFFDDPTKTQINGTFPNLTVASFAPSAKYQVFKNERLKVAVSGAVELLELSSDPGLFNTTNKKSSEYFGIGKVEVPVTYNANQKLQLHFTPGVVFYPDKVKGADFYGTFVNLGAGISWQSSEKLNLFANGNLPLGPGGNTLNSQDNSISRKLLWTAGTRYAINPRAGIEVYGTNAFGATPTTSLLSFIPDGNEVIFGANVKYIFDFGQNYASSFGNKPDIPLSNRDKQLLLDGLTLSSASTLSPDQIRLTAGLTSGGNAKLNLMYGLANDLQLEIPIEQFGNDDNLSSSESFGNATKFGAGAKLRFLNQAQGDPFSLSLKVKGVRDSKRPRVGTLSAEMPIVYQNSNTTALFFNPKAAFYRQQERFGLGLGINQVLSNKLQLIAEITSVPGHELIWSTGLRYFESGADLGLDIYASNTSGQNGIGGLVADTSTNIGFNVHWLFRL
ncbi:MAG: porin [Richelia sp. RM2_1_2]|nr:porin [Richelia sp. SM1_7_0]NJN09163.1 porin [Richelia sp. RM1_1_1]NJO58504.1 porin [Richelia sp. RM2_1_2]